MQTSLDQIRLLCVPCRNQRPQCGVCINPHMLSSSVSIPLLTLSDLVGDHE